MNLGFLVEGMFVKLGEWSCAL